MLDSSPSIYRGNETCGDAGERRLGDLPVAPIGAKSEIPDDRGSSNRPRPDFLLA
jgi:hypothetical protein